MCNSCNKQLNIEQLGTIPMDNLIEMYKQGYTLNGMSSPTQNIKSMQVTCAADEVALPLLDKCVKKNYLIYGGVGLVLLLILTRG